jgi:hypothetical protein
MVKLGIMVPVTKGKQEKDPEYLRRELIKVLSELHDEIGSNIKTLQKKL